MPKRIGVFVDVSNLYYCIKKKCSNKRLSYKNYLNFVKPLGTITKCIAYGSQLKNEASAFIEKMQKTGYTTRYKTPKTYLNKGEIIRKCDWDVGMCMDIVKNVSELDMIVLGSADGDMSPCVDWAKAQGVPCLVIACGVSADLRTSAERVIEIPKSFLEEGMRNDRS